MLHILMVHGKVGNIVIVIRSEKNFAIFVHTQIVSFNKLMFPKSQQPSAGPACLHQYFCYFSVYKHRKWKRGTDRWNCSDNVQSKKNILHFEYIILATFYCAIPMLGGGQKNPKYC